MTVSPSHDDPSASEEPTFDVLSLAQEVRQAIDELGYVHPTPVQRAVFEPAARGADLVVQARTGTGKTAAFGLPIVNSLVRKNVDAVQALVLCPTRELSLQVCKELKALGQHIGLNIVAIYGGAPMPKQVDELAAGAQLVCGTPGRVLDHLRRGTLDPARIRVFVLDESDEMLSMGFLPQINDIMAFLPESRQTLLFSATVPGAVTRMAEERLSNPEFITLSGDQVGALEIQHFVYLSYGDKIADLKLVLETEDPESAIVFCNTKDQTKRTAAALQQQGYSADWLNADLSQNDRERVMARTRGGELRFLVATDVAARGIDISHLTHVINFDFPESAEAYVHRTGRTGRAGRTGTAISLVAPSDVGSVYMVRLTYGIRPIERHLPSAQDLKTRAEADVLASLARMFGARSLDAADVGLARRLLTHEQAELIVAGLLRDHLGEQENPTEDAARARRSRLPEPTPSRDDSTGDRARPRRTRRRAERDDERRRPRRTEPSGSDAAQAAKGRDPGEEAEPRDGLSDAAAAAGGGRAATGARDPSDAAAAGGGEDYHAPAAEVYVNVGRRDGASPEHFMALLEAGEIEASEIERINVRQRHTFIAVPRRALQRAIAAVQGASIGGKQAAAEEARRADEAIAD